MTETARRLRVMILEDRERELFRRIQNRQDLDAAQCELLALQRERDGLPPIVAVRLCDFCFADTTVHSYACPRCGWKVSA